MSYNQTANDQAAATSLASKSAIEAYKWASNLSMASNTFCPTSLSSVPAPILFTDKASLLLSSALASHSKDDWSTA